MCCILTAGSWILDTISRCWIFAMSAIIFTAIACTLLTASASGVALGYNYSMAEFIQLRESNVSVYLKRGVFDDEVDNEKNYQRKGQLPKYIKDDLEAENERYIDPENRRDERRAMPKPVRTLDESIIESNFRGSLRRLTARPLPDLAAPATSKGFVTPEHFTTEKVIGSLLKQYKIDGKSMQGLINRLKLDRTSIASTILPARPPLTPDPFFFLKRYKAIPDVLSITGSEDPGVDAFSAMEGEDEDEETSSISDVELLRKPTPDPDFYDERRPASPRTIEEVHATSKSQSESDHDLQKKKEGDSANDSHTDYRDDDIKGYPSRKRRSKRSDRRSDTISTEDKSHTHRKEPSRNINDTAKAAKERNKRNDGSYDKFEAIFGPLKKHILIRDKVTQTELTDPYIVTSSTLVLRNKPVDGILNTVNVTHFEPSSNEDLILKLIKSSLS